MKLYEYFITSITDKRIVLLTLIVAALLILLIISDDVETFGNDDEVIYILSSNKCPHCRNLKKSGEIEKLKSNGIRVKVIDIDNDQNSVRKIASKVKTIDGVPAIIFRKNNRYYLYEGERLSEQIYKKFTIF